MPATAKQVMNCLLILQKILLCKCWEEILSHKYLQKHILGIFSRTQVNLSQWLTLLNKISQSVMGLYHCTFCYVSYMSDQCSGK